jgi:hypothetical protein
VAPITATGASPTTTEKLKTMYPIPGSNASWPGYVIGSGTAASSGSLRPTNITQPVTLREPTFGPITTATPDTAITSGTLITGTSTTGTGVAPIVAPPVVTAGAAGWEVESKLKQCSLMMGVVWLVYFIWL